MFKRMLFAFAIAVIPATLMADEVVRYQLSEWKAKHIHNEKSAETITKTLTKLGCEIKKVQHNGHIDIRYRCPKWKELKLDTHENAHKWEKWLKEFQFKTVHKH